MYRNSNYKDETVFYDKPTLVQIMAWCWLGDKPLFGYDGLDWRCIYVSLSLNELITWENVYIEMALWHYFKWTQHYFTDFFSNTILLVYFDDKSSVVLITIIWSNPDLLSIWGINFNEIKSKSRTSKKYAWKCHLHTSRPCCVHSVKPTLIARFMGPTWGPSGADRTQVGLILATWTLLSG